MSQQAEQAGGPAEGVLGGVLIIDFGAQYCQLIARRIRELGVYSRITVPARAMFTLKHMRPKAIILSGGPCSVYADDAPTLEAFLRHAARGGLVDEDALFEALSNNRIAGAALDCFEVEPVTEPHRFGELENVILAPHSIAWTDELFRDMGRTACQSMLDLSRGQRPCGVLNAELFDRASFREKWARVIGSSQAQIISHG